MGESGSGKTSLLNILLGLDKDFKGQIIGFDNKSFSVVFQENRLLENLSILDNINFVLDEEITSKELELYLKDINLLDAKNKKIRELSGGMKRRISILRAVLKKADIYIFDEPFKDLDEYNHKNILSFVKEKLENKTLIFTSHNKEDPLYLKANILEIKK